MTAPITATNPAELRQEAERLLAEGLPVAPPVLLAVAGANPRRSPSPSLPACWCGLDATREWSCDHLDLSISRSVP